MKGHWVRNGEYQDVENREDETLCLNGEKMRGENLEI